NQGRRKYRSQLCWYRPRTLVRGGTPQIHSSATQRNDIAVSKWQEACQCTLPSPWRGRGLINRARQPSRRLHSGAQPAIRATVARCAIFAAGSFSIRSELLGRYESMRQATQAHRGASCIPSGPVDHVRRTGQLPDEIPSGGMHIGARLLIERRGWDIELREDEQLVYNALVRDQKQRRQTRTLKDREPFRRLDLIYGNAPCGRLVFMERSKALDNIAFRKAKTWGDFREGAPTLYERALSDLDNEEEAPLDSSELDHELAAD